MTSAFPSPKWWRKRDDALSSSNSSTPTQTPTQTSVAQAVPTSTTSQKYVVAHHMVGNTFPYTIDDWAADIALAHSSGIDAFALNVERDDWQPARVADAYQAASQSGTDFKLFMSFDMSSLPCASADDAQTLRTYITTYATHPNQFKYGGSVFASTFAGESCTFGQSSVPQGWSSQFTKHPELSGQNAVHFVPSFFVDPATFNTFADVMDGDFNFNSGWPIQVTTSFAQSVLSSVGAALSSLFANPTAKQALGQFVGSTDTDTQHISALAGMNAGAKTYMAAVSPWFFTHYGQDTFNKNFIYLTDNHLYATRWENLVSTRDKIDIVEIVTWNDYGESHYIGPIKGAQPNSQAWVDGFDHTGWLALTSYYAAAFKSGSYPQITEDRIIMWARPHPANANAPDPVGLPANAQITQDTLWALALTTAPSTVTLTTSASSAQTFSVPAGVSKLSVGLVPGDGMRGTIERGGAVVAEAAAEGFVFEGEPGAYNFNAFVAASP
ncbi:glycoside hydrolase family 71 protein [Plicaturopsis crispa FD-325 SS-3]|nr:glycoside hydrolase family 71 protein [Plicaturopsis crispa FD-325 SS-3]